MTGELQKGIKLFLWDFEDIMVLRDQLNSLPEEGIIVVAREQPIINSRAEIIETFQNFKTDILLSGSALFDYADEKLRYYYWKYYPRQDTPYDYAGTDAIVGKVAALKTLADDLQKLIKQGVTATDALNRIYVDSISGFSQKSYSIKIDHKQKLIGSSQGRTSALRLPLWSKIQAYLFFHHQQRNGTSTDLVKKEGTWINKKTKTQPALVFLGKGHRSSVWLSLRTYARSLGQTLTVLLHNKGESRLYKLFRYAPNHGADVKKSIDKLIELLENGTPFCFSHFNDGELTFINKYENADHKEVWFGRRQNQYTEKLGKLLVQAFLLKKKNYFIGIPCGKSHPRLRKLATGLRTPDDYTIAAMTLHHNIDRYPRILGMLKDKILYYVTNPYQDLTFFEALGLKVKEQNRINVPFKNSHKEYDKLKDYKFEENAVILMMCGMLGKVLTPTWFEQNPTCTFLTFGSSFDDMIQQNINFKLLPKEAPFARHIVGTRSFLFGAKKSCSDCFDLKNPSSVG